MNQNLLRKLPKVDVLLASPLLAEAEKTFSKNMVKEAAQKCLQDIRTSILNGETDTVPSPAVLAEQILKELHRVGGDHLKKVINATGVVLHTNLGRAPLGEDAAAHIARIVSGYCNLEYDIEAGTRGSRYSHVEELLCRLTGAEAAMVVNNNAGAVFLMLNTLAKGKNVAISRGELVEIGGSFRVPEIMEQSGSHLVEVGTTNKTHEEDYLDAIRNQDAAVLLKVHTSNFSMIGFTESVPVAGLSKIAKESNSLVLYDIGSCFLFPGEYLGIHGGETARSALQDGADVVCFSGDKLTASSQAGILVGKKEYIDRMKRNHLTRMLRVDKLCLAALETGLRHWLDPKEAREKVPALRMLSMTPEDCKARAEALKNQLSKAAPSLLWEVEEVQDEVGGGSLPGLMLDGFARAVSSEKMDAMDIERFLRLRDIPIVTRIWKDRVLISPRTLCAGDESELQKAFEELEAAK